AETQGLELLRQGNRLRGGRAPLASTRSWPADNAIAENEIGVSRTKIDNQASVVDGCGDLGAVTDDARVAQQSYEVVLVEGGYQRWLKAYKGSPKVLPLAENGDPGQAGLECLQGHALIKTLHTADRLTPLVVVISEI